MAGKITVITGPMRSGKTREVILRALDAEYFGKKVIAYHPNISSRWGDNALVSRIKLATKNEGFTSHRLSYPSNPVDTSLSHFLMNLPPVDLVIFDDAQFFTESIVTQVRALRYRGIDVFISGLDIDAFQQPFGPMPLLMAIADEVIKKVAVCEDCDNPAQCTYRVTNDSQQVLVGDKEYISLCWDCWKARKNEEVIDFKFED